MTKVLVNCVSDRGLFSFLPKKIKKISNMAKKIIIYSREISVSTGSFRNITLKTVLLQHNWWCVSFNLEIVQIEIVDRK